MAIKPEDRPKLIGLSVALVGVIAYVLIALVPKLFGGAAPAAPVEPPPTATLTAASVKTSAAGQAGSGEASAALPDEDTSPIPPAPPRDSFTPPTATNHPAAPAAALGAQPSAPITPAGIVGPVGPMGVSPMVVSIPQAAPLPPVELKGVILGETAVAVISVNGEVIQRQVGETIAGGLKLAKISELGITVQDGSRYLPVTVGHMMAGSPQPAAQNTPPPTVTTTAH